MIVVSDTSCVSNLLAIGRVALLHQLFGEVVVPHAVWGELRAEHEELPEFLRLETVRDPSAVQELVREPLDEGEAEAIVLAEQLGADYLLMDETAGRAAAHRRGLRVLGLLGVIREAKTRGLIPALKPLIDSLRDDAGFWISAELRRRVLEEAGEN